MTELTPAPASPGTYEQWKAYAEKLEQEVFDYAAEVEASWAGKHVLLVMVISFIAGWVL